MPLLRRIGCVVSYMTAGAEIKRVHRAGGGGAGDGTLRLSHWT